MKTEFPYYFGDLFVTPDAVYILALVDSNHNEGWMKVTLINLSNGNRWSDPLEISVVDRFPTGIYAHELSLLINGNVDSVFSEWEHHPGSRAS